MLNNNEDKFKFVCINPFVRSNQISKLTNDKNLNVAKQLKTDGNKAFQANDYSNALFKYSKSVLKCPQDNGGEYLALSVYCFYLCLFTVYVKKIVIEKKIKIIFNF